MFKVPEVHQHGRQTAQQSRALRKNDKRPLLGSADCCALWFTLLCFLGSVSSGVSQCRCKAGSMKCTWAQVTSFRFQILSV